jgi:hypothetical protein
MFLPCASCTGNIGTGQCRSPMRCIVRMAEIFDHHIVLTLDSNFPIYRKQGRTPLALTHPGN